MMTLLRNRVFLQSLAARLLGHSRAPVIHSSNNPALFYAGHLVTRLAFHHKLLSSSTPTTMERSIESQEIKRPTTAIRSAALADATAIAELGAHVFTVTFGHSVEPHELQAFLDEAYSLKAIMKDLKDPNKDTIMATDSTGDILGFAMLTRGTSEPCLNHLDGLVELQRIYMYPKAHGTGAGKLLASKLEDMARDQGFKYIWLGVWQENHRAKKAYEKWGYKACGTHDFAVGPVVQTDDIMVKRL
ncbi:acyl-CoA N-acyltransferase [Colletotrichum navitas]|uniref:Acyl-CoA N-acyltransferase n=1 Tax=Colletotrichum navitas TaxID=681940 RepID=A0AAD8V2X2_9PEZI|nr:acyl-CoA N-acyltransferase [Colletotrichum navitas]KAK1590265.1 acyl-CoA N-acyltransferase [Colletotrichum navitas]